MTTPPMSPTASEVRIVRTLRAEPSKVYRAWLDPDLIRQWFAPSEFTASHAEVDERVGGRHSVHHSQDGEDRGGAESTLLELVPDRRIVLSWNFVGPDRVPDPSLESLLTIDLEPTADGGTRLTLVHSRLDGLKAAMPDVAGGVEQGWQGALDSLATTTGATA